MELKKNVKNENGTNELEIGIDSAAYQAAVASVFKKNAKKYRVPGFRPGKAPRHLIEQMYGKDVFLYDAVNEMFPEAKYQRCTVHFYRNVFWQLRETECIK